VRGAGCATVLGVSGYLVESYLPGSRASQLDELAGRARLTAEAMALGGTPIRFVRYTYVPEDEVCLLLFEAASVEIVDAVAKQAGISFERIVSVVEAAAGRQAEPTKRSS